MTKVNVISGFLGAGKTTLIKKLLDEALKGEKIVLIDADFTELVLDEDDLLPFEALVQQLLDEGGLAGP